MVMVEVLSASAFGLVPSDQLFARELHAAGKLGLSTQQIPMLVECCTFYTADADTLMVQMAGDVSEIQRIVYGEKLPGTTDLDRVDRLLMGWSYRALELGRTWVRHRVNGLRELDADQVRRVSEVRQGLTVALAGAVREGSSDKAVEG
jgi:hypothetical protein